MDKTDRDYNKFFQRRNSIVIALTGKIACKLGVIDVTFSKNGKAGSVLPTALVKMSSQLTPGATTMLNKLSTFIVTVLRDSGEYSEKFGSRIEHK